MWWVEVLSLGRRLAAAVPGGATSIDPTAVIEAGAVLDDSTGPIVIGARTRVCAGAVVRGPAVIARDGMVGNQALLRGPLLIGAQVRIGFATEIKQALIGERVSIGPMCFVADSRIDADAYLGAMVRTSNQRLDRATISVERAEPNGARVRTDSGSAKLGCWIGAGASLGIQVIVLPGREIAAGALFEPRITISKNLPAAHYRVRQTLETVPPVLPESRLPGPVNLPESLAILTPDSGRARAAPKGLS